MLLDDWPDIVDDDGSGKYGTPASKSVTDAMKSAIEAVVHSSSNPTITPADSVDEVKTARGNLASLNTRVSVVVDVDGNPIVDSSLVVTPSQFQGSMGAGHNLIQNGTFWLASAGRSVPPDYWEEVVAFGAGSVAMTGTGESDTTRKVGAKAYKLTWASGLYIMQTFILSTADFATLDVLKGRKVGFGAWVKTSVDSNARLFFWDGVSGTYTDFHTGGGGWEWLSGVHTISGSAVNLSLAVHAAAGDLYVSGVTACFSEVAPDRWLPERVIRGSALLELSGEMGTGDDQKRVFFSRPVRIDNLQAVFLTDAPTGAAFQIDFEKNAAGVWTSMIGGAASIVADGDSFGSVVTSGDYDLRCLSGLFLGSGASIPSGAHNKIARLNIDQVGSSTPGTGLLLRLDGVQPVHPFENHIGYDYLGGI